MHVVPRDQTYGQPMRWGPLYKRHFPHRTDATSRHVGLIASALRDVRSPLRRLLSDAGYEPDHWAESMEITVKMLWEAREKIEKLEAGS
jgi:hypothetical protein